MTEVPFSAFDAAELAPVLAALADPVLRPLSLVAAWGESALAQLRRLLGGE